MAFASKRTVRRKGRSPPPEHGQSTTFDHSSAIEAAEQFDLDAVIGLTEAQAALETCLEPAVTQSIDYCHIDFVNVAGTLILKGHGMLAAPNACKQCTLDLATGETNSMENPCAIP